MKLPFRLVPIFALLPICITTAAQNERSADLRCRCEVREEMYVVTIENTGQSPKDYWIVPVDVPRSAFCSVPIGATAYVSAPPFVADRGMSSATLVSDSIRLPVTMSHLQAGEKIEYRFRLSALWAPWVGTDKGGLRSGGKKFLIRVKVFTDPYHLSCITCDSLWTDF